MSAPGEALGAKTLILMSDRNKVYQLIDAGLKEKITGEISEMAFQENGDSLVPDIRKINPSLVIAVGNAAALWAQQEISDIPLIVSGVISQSNNGIFSEVPGVSLDCSLQSYFNLIREMVPEKGNVGLLIGADQQTETRKEIENLAKNANLEAKIARPRNVKEVSQSIETVYAQGAGVFLMTFDPLIMNPESFNYIIEFSISKSLVLITPSRALLKRGAFASLEADYSEIGRRTAAIANDLLKNPDRSGKYKLEFPPKEEISVNRKIANSLHINISPTTIQKAGYIQD